MKKLYVIAAAALALAACSKTEVVNTTSNDTAISFQVAKYSSLTKAGELSLVTDEGISEFKTYAWFTSNSGTDQEFMAPATVEWNSTDTEWAPTDRVYYWPKTGYINFFSFAGNHLPNSVDNTGAAHYTDVITVATNDNILVADGAYGFYQNTKPATYGLDGVSEGVPTLFRHMLSRVVFDIKVDATDATDARDHWKVTINSAELSYRNQGKLEVTFPAAPTISLGTDGKPTSAGTTQQNNSHVWTPESGANVALNKVSSAIVFDVDGGSESSAETLIEDSVVMPQVLATTDVTIALNYTLVHTYDGGTAITETVPILATALTTVAPTITEWAANTIYKYHITIKPAADNRILFDPAVEAWAEVANDEYVIK